jgi:hypothetical protein
MRTKPAATPRRGGPETFVFASAAQALADRLTIR